MKNIAKIAAMALSAFAVAMPAHATADASAAAKANASSAEEGGVRTAEARKYCLTLEPDTGSRLRKHQCKTKAEWAEYGVELTPKK
jgi:hypothetical protein